MPNDLNAILEEQYGKHVDPVVCQHVEAQRCLDVEEILGVGVMLFANIRRRWEKCPGERIEDFADAMRRWRRDTKRWLVIGKRFRESGYDVKYLTELRTCYEIVRYLDLDSRGLAEAFDRLEAGEGLDLDTFFDGLQDSH